MGRWKPHALSMGIQCESRPSRLSFEASTDSDLETMERLQIGVGPIPKSPLLLRDQKKGIVIMGLFDDIIKKFVDDGSDQSTTTRTQKKKSSNGKRKKGYTTPTADGTIVIEYLNYAGDLKQFIGDPKSIRRKGNHFSVRVAPTFKRISLNRSKTRILKGVAAPAQLPKEPLPVQTTTSNTSIIHYTNWQGVQKEFKIISGVVDDKGDFVRVRVSPTFQYITLKRTRIGNPEALFEKTPGQEPATLHEPQPVSEEPASNTSGQVSLIITSCGLGTYDATKIIQEIRPELGTFDTYQLMRDFPNTIADNLAPDAAAQFKKRLEDAGCTVEIK